MEQFAPFCLFNGTCLFIMLYLAETKERQINLDGYSPIPLANIHHLPHPPWFSLQTTSYVKMYKKNVISFGVCGGGGGGFFIRILQ
jgi:hypothetical protein